MLKFTVHITAVHLFTCDAKAVTSWRSREYLATLKKGAIRGHTSVLCHIKVVTPSPLGGSVGPDPLPPPPPGKSQIAKGFKEYKRVSIRTGYF